ncbi:MAG: hypothetical protein R2882_06485 [Gemmatimonadales bacterium]
MLHRSWKTAASVALIGLALGCAEGMTTTTADADEALAAEFDGMTAEANTAGDPDAGAAFSGAALAVRLGIRPSDIPVNVGGEVRRYLAFVHMVTTNRGGTPVTKRTMVAVRRNDAGRPIEVLYVVLPADSADFVHPASAQPAPGGLSVWKDLAAKQFYLALRGFGVLRPTAREGDCPNVAARSAVQCTVAKFSVRLDGVYHALIDNQRYRIDPDRKVEIASRAEDVNGAVITFP